MKKLVYSFTVLAVLSIFLAMPSDAKANDFGFSANVYVDPFTGVPVNSFAMFNTDTPFVGFNTFGFNAGFSTFNSFDTFAIRHRRAVIVAPRRTVIRTRTVIR